MPTQSRGYGTQITEVILLTILTKEWPVFVFISEYLTCGAWNAADLPASLLKEGGSMLQAIADDFANLPDCRVAITWNKNLGECPLSVGEAKNVEVHAVRNPEEEARRFAELGKQADAVLVIAPEFQNLLADRCRIVGKVGPASLNCSVEAIHLCTDKLALARQLESLQIPTIPTRELPDLENASAAELEFPLVIKPRDGAGSQANYLIHDQAAWQDFWVKSRESRDKSQTKSDGPRTEWIVQPFVAGKTLSIAAIVGDVQWNGEPWLEVFPLAEQQLTRDGRFGYIGGRIPDTIPLQHLATQRVREIVDHLPGLSGYIGLDLLAPTQDPEDLLIVEINPRLTTSYLGYRALADQNLAEYLLPACRPDEPLRWKPQVVRFTAEGIVSWNERLR